MEGVAVGEHGVIVLCIAALRVNSNDIIKAKDFFRALMDIFSSRRSLLASLIVSASVALGACATTQLANDVPDSYKGETAWLDDHTYQETGSVGRIFAVVSIDGVTYDNAFRRTNQATAGRGFSLMMVSAGRKVVAGKAQTFVLRASHVHAAPIQAMISSASGTNLSVEKTYTFTPESGKRYVVQGLLKVGEMDVWLEDAQTGRKVTP
jgi:hypothetical protein